MAVRFRRGPGLVVGLAAGLALAGCGSSPPGSKTAAQLIPEIVAAAKSATSAHVSGSGTEGSQNVVLDMSFSGGSAAGTVGSNGQRYHFLSLNGRTFVKLDASFLKIAKAPASACAKVCGKYVEIPAAEAARITGALSLHKILTQAFDNKNTKDAEQGGCVFSPATVNGQQVLQCSQGGYTLDVAAHGKPYPVYLTGPNGEQLSFSSWNAVALPRPPPASEVISTPYFG